MRHKLKSVKFSIVLLSALAVSGLGIYFFKTKQHESFAMQDAAVKVHAEHVRQGSIPIVAKAIGTLTAAQHVEITPEISGQVAKIFFQNGGVFVKKGTPLIQLDDSTFRAKLASDKANLIYSQADYRRKMQLGKLGAISQQAIDQALADLKTKQADVEQSQVAVDKMLLSAPFDGVLGKFNISPGDYVSVGQRLVSLTDIQHLHAEYSVAEKFLASLHLGQKIKIYTSAYPGQEFSGTVAFISPTINTEDRTISLYADVPNDERKLTAGLYVNVLQELGKKENALLLPAASLVPMIDGEQIYKIVDKKVQTVTVKTGQRDAQLVEILSGVKPDDLVVVAGQDKLKDGSQVAITE